MDKRMKIRIKNRISASEADRLIEKYYEGLTSLKEEKLISDFLLQQDIPERFAVEKDIFGYFGHKKHKAVFSISPFIRWTGVAAGIISVIFCLRVLTNIHTSNYACIDGEKTTNMTEIKNQALASLSGMSSKTNEVEEGFKNLDNHESVEQQLKVFSAAVH
jgi:hypothetical protein